MTYKTKRMQYELELNISQSITWYKVPYQPLSVTSLHERYSQELVSQDSGTKMCSKLTLVVLISLIGCAELITVTTPHRYVNVTRGHSVLLQCNFQTSHETTSLTIQWSFDSTSSMSPQPIFYYQAGTDVIPKGYEDRLQPPSAPGTTKNASIIISNMQPSDSGVYSCEVHNLPDIEGQTQVNIIVNVLEKPSVPYCAVHGDVEAGHLVTLTCHSEKGSPRPKYTWIRLDQTKTRRPVLGRMTTTGILEFKNISQFQFGEYQCNATNVVGFSTCTVDLSPEVADGVIAAAVIGALLGCVLIFLVVWFIAHTLKRKKYKAVKASEANEMKRSSPQTQEGAVTMTTTAGNLHDEEDEPHA
ncbi:V-set and immunoglobulin domain-containing protein 1-like [Aulostomus maculatus]